MCGIFGYIDRSGALMDSKTLKAMGESISHRGPDDSGIFTGNGVALGNRRLSIIDIEHGHQPFVSDDGKIAVVQNGEIYNYVELAEELSKVGRPCRTHSDTEVILRLYEEYGTDFVTRLNGMFAIAIYDARKGELILARDRIGIKPLFIHDDGKRLLFSSEIKALLKAGIPREMNPEGLHHFLSFNYIPPPRTIFKGVTHLEAGTMMRVSVDGTETARWWDLTAVAAEERTDEEWISELNDTLDDAVRLRLRSDAPFGAFLSGGVDSATVVGLMARHMKEPVKTFCIGFHDPAFDEAPYALTAAERFGASHTMERVDLNMLSLWPLATYHCDQPHGDVSFLPTYKVSELAARHVKVVLTGDGGDELFAGYDKYKNFFAGDDAFQGDDEDFRGAYYRNISLFDDDFKSRLYTTDFAAKLKDVSSYDEIKVLFERSSHMDRINQALYIDMIELLAGNNLVKPDRMGMAVSLEARTPFLDYRMMELAFRIPGSLKIKDGETKYILKKAVAPLIGRELAYRKKQMFTVPVGNWFRDSLSGATAGFILSDRAIDRGLFRREVIEDILGRHKSGASNYTREIRALISLELWFRTFIDDAPEGPLAESPF